MTEESAGHGIHVVSRLGDGSHLSIAANLSDQPWDVPADLRQGIAHEPAGNWRTLFQIPERAAEGARAGRLPAWSAVIAINERPDERKRTTG